MCSGTNYLELECEKMTLGIGVRRGHNALRACKAYNEIASQTKQRDRQIIRTRMSGKILDSEA